MVLMVLCPRPNQHITKPFYYFDESKNNVEVRNQPANQHHFKMTIESFFEAMMTLVASANILMSSVHRRWLTRREIVMIQGFPCTSHDTHGVPCSSYAKRHHDAYHGRESSDWPSRRAVCEQAGNSMHTAISGVVMLFTLTQVMMPPDMMYLQVAELQRTIRVNIDNRMMLSQSSQGSTPRPCRKRTLPAPIDPSDHSTTSPGDQDTDLGHEHEHVNSNDVENVKKPRTDQIEIEIKF